MKIKTAYISGALTNLDEVESWRMKQIYEGIAKTCAEMGVDAYVPHLHSDPDKHAHISPAEVYELDTKEVLARDLLIIEASHPSHGAGGEAVQASLGKKAIFLCSGEGFRVSRYVRGIPGVALEIKYRSLDDLQLQLTAWLHKQNR